MRVVVDSCLGSLGNSVRCRPPFFAINRPLLEDISFSKRNRTRRVDIIFIIFLRFSLICFELLRLLKDMIVHMVSNSYYPVSLPLVYCMCAFSKMYIAPLLWTGWSVLVLWFPPVRLFLSCGLLRPSVLSPLSRGGNSMHRRLR